MFLNVYLFVNVGSYMIVSGFVNERSLYSRKD